MTTTRDSISDPFVGQLYGGGPELRLQQELVLGIGRWLWISVRSSAVTRELKG